MMKLLQLLQAMLTLGRDEQSFIGARWLVVLLRLTPRPWQRSAALRVVALSPHYFYRSFHRDYPQMPTRGFLEAERARNQISRGKLTDQVLGPFLRADLRVLDIGCGPGFMARAVAARVAQVYACDISPGVLECARILHGAPNIVYLLSGETGLAPIPDASLDLIYSFAVIQHVREEVIRSLFALAAAKLKRGGRCVWQVQLEEGKWKSEEQWTEDHSIRGRLRLRYALNFFPRSEAFFRELASGTGFNVDSLQPLADFMDEPYDDVYHQHLLLLTRQ